MTVEAVAQKLDFTLLAGKSGIGREIESGYVCDLLSWAMSRAQAGTAWITIQTHINVIAVASLTDMACVIVPEDAAVDPGALDKAEEEGIPVLSSKLTAYELCVKLSELGIATA
ncbi:MAG: AraC family transcriptional regulator [Christensenellales bacterium]|jgi:serine kinase of HPr protein (carbohydrate metabolism regulator)